MPPRTPRPSPPGRIERLPSGVEVLSVAVRVEPFENGAHVRLLVSQRSDAPDEIEISVRSESGSAPMEYCILTATMGNKARARRLWLADGYASSLDLYPGYQGDGFAPHAIFPLDRLRRTERGDVLAAITTDEADPASVDPFPGRPGWRYAGVPVTQHWKKRAGSERDDLHVAINARATYWLSRQPIPGGVAIENFEMRERFTEGQSFVFGITRKTRASSDPPPANSPPPSGAAPEARHPRRFRARRLRRTCPSAAPKGRRSSLASRASGASSRWSSPNRVDRLF